MNDNKGFTLIEVIVAMALVMVVIMISSSAFNTILTNSARLSVTEEGNIEGVVGLEMFRHDIQQAGFGLPHAYVAAPSYSEVASGYSLANSLNDAASGVPRALVAIDSVSGTNATYNVLPGTDYLAVKSTTVGRNATAQKWTFLGYTTVGAKAPNQWLNSDDNLKDGQSKIIVLNRTVSSGIVTNTLIYNTATPEIYWATYYSDSLADAAFYPTSSQQVYYLYGVDDSSLRMPFNRADFFVAKPSGTANFPKTCAPGTGILYKAVVKHANGGLDYIPLMDCVADMQIVYGWDMYGNGVIDESTPAGTGGVTVSNGQGSTTTGTDLAAVMADPGELRKKLKYIKVYVMVQEGKRDNSYLESGKIIVGDNNNEALTKGYLPSATGTTPTLANCGARSDTACTTDNNWRKYRWKIYKLVVRPKNLT